MKRKLALFLLALLLLSSFGTYLHLVAKANIFNNRISYNPNSNDAEIIILTPENKTYTAPMTGYYPATYSFENDIDGTVPEEWTQQNGVGCTSNVTSAMGYHKKVVDLYDTSPSNKSMLIRTFDTTRNSGTIEFWHLTSDKSKIMEVRTYNALETRAGPYLGIDGGYYRYNDGVWHNVFALNDNEWYHHRIEFDCTTHTFNWFINDALQGTGNSGFASPDCENLGHLFFVTSHPAINYHQYIDAVGFSWDSNYEVGDNLNEGLLLSIENSTLLDWIGYSLDEQANKTILGNVTIPMPLERLHTIQVFGNNTIGTAYESDIVHFSVDTTAPEISIIYPSTAQEFSDPPAFILTINESNIDALWYTLNGGTEIPFTGITGIVSNSAWNALPNGPVTIGFTVRDIALREATQEVIIVKKSSEGSIPPAIPGYNLYIIIGMLSIISLILIEKKLKS